MTDEQLPPTFEQSMSALMDGEADDLELRRLLRQMPGDPQLRAAWSRYQLVSALVRGERPEPVASLDMADRILAELGKPAHSVQAAGSRPVLSLWKKSVASLAVAASFAFLVVGLDGKLGEEASPSLASRPVVGVPVAVSSEPASPVAADRLLLQGQQASGRGPLVQQPVALEVDRALLPLRAGRPPAAR